MVVKQCFCPLPLEAHPGHGTAHASSPGSCRETELCPMHRSLLPSWVLQLTSISPHRLGLSPQGQLALMPSSHHLHPTHTPISPVHTCTSPLDCSFREVKSKIEHMWADEMRWRLRQEKSAVPVLRSVTSRARVAIYYGTTTLRYEADEHLEARTTYN